MGRLLDLLPVYLGSNLRIQGEAVNRRTFRRLDATPQEAMNLATELQGRLGFYEGKQWVCGGADFRVLS